MRGWTGVKKTRGCVKNECWTAKNSRTGRKSSWVNAFLAGGVLISGFPGPDRFHQWQEEPGPACHSGPVALPDDNARTPRGASGFACVRVSTDALVAMGYPTAFRDSSSLVRTVWHKGSPDDVPNDKRRATRCGWRGAVDSRRCCGSYPLATCNSLFGFSKNCSSSVEFLRAVVDAWLPDIVVVIASK